MASLFLQKYRKEILERIALRHNRNLFDAIAVKARSLGALIQHGDFQTFAGGALFVPTSDYAPAMSEITTSTSHRILVCPTNRATRPSFRALMGDRIRRVAG